MSKLNISKDLKGRKVYNIGKPQNYYNQRNNEIDPHNTCNTTNIIQGLELVGHTNFPNPQNVEYSQPEDRLTLFTRTDDRVLQFYRDNYPDMYVKYINKERGYYLPNEIHKINEFSTNLFMNSRVIKFTENLGIEDIIKEILIKEKPVVMSVKFGKLHHIVTLVGVVTTFESKSKNKEDLTFNDLYSFVYDDSYGYFDFTQENYVKNKRGNDCWVDVNTFIEVFKPINNAESKWGYTFL